MFWRVSSLQCRRDIDNKPHKHSNIGTPHGFFWSAGSLSPVRSPFSLLHPPRISVLTGLQVLLILLRALFFQAESNFVSPHLSLTASEM